MPIVRGPEISRRLGDIVREVEELAADGVREITVLGQNVNSYGRDLGAGQYRPQFADLLRALDAVDGIERIRFTSPHPKDLRPETIAAMAECGAVCEHLHLPLQSGSDRTLARMHRGYTAERYLRRLADARAAIPDLAVTTDLIVGFPGETDADFVRTLEVVDAAEYDAAYTFVFSPRPGTPAADMTDDFVAPEVAQERMSRLIEVVERHALAKHEARVGRTETLLVEGPSKKDRDVWSGRTRQNKLVHFAPGVHEPEVGGGADVRITRAAPHWLRGDLLAMRRPRPVGPASASPSPPRLRDRTAPRDRRPHRLGEVGARTRGGRRVRGRRDRVGRLDAGLPRARHRDGQAHRRRARRGPAPPGRRGRARRGVVGGAVPARSTRRDRRHRASRAAAPCSSAAPVCTCRRSSTRSPSRRRTGRSATRMLARTATPEGLAAAYAELQRVDPAAAARIEPGNARRMVRALEVIQLTGRPFSSFGAGLQEFGPPVFPVRIVGVWLPRAVLDDRIERRFAAMRGAGLVDEVRGLEARASAVAHRPAGDRVPGGAGPPRR